MKTRHAPFRLVARLKSAFRISAARLIEGRRNPPAPHAHPRHSVGLDVRQPGPEFRAVVLAPGLPTLFKALEVCVFSFVCLLLLPACQIAFGDFTIDTAKLAVSCEPNVFRCDGDLIETCVNGNEWKLIVGCPAHQCNLATLSCKPCQPGSYQCSDAQPQVCGTDQTWGPATPAPCASAALCNVPDDGSPINCVTPGCPTAGQLQCADDHLQVCPSTQTDWQDVEICASAALCDSVAASARVAQGKFATCEAPACSVGEFQCNAGSPEPCKTDRTGWGAATMSCSTSGACNPDTGDCSACSVGTYTCSGTELERCNEQQVWTAVSSCSEASLCDATDAVPLCKPPVCTPGAFQCSTESELQRCRSDGSALDRVEQCLNAALCNPRETRCEPPQCPAGGAFRCNGNEQQTCRQDLTGWDIVMTCADAGSCDPLTGCVAPCTNGAYRCNDVALEQCVNQLWVHQADCASIALCDSSNHVCTAPTCAAGERKCFGSSLERCSASLDGWDDLTTCDNGEVCNPTTASCELM
jgi:hypothetical protein